MGNDCNYFIEQFKVIVGDLNFQHNIIRLKKLFNDLYVKMSKVKENELEVMEQRNDRLIKIQKDINLVQRLNGDEATLFDPIPKFDRFSDENPNALLAIATCTLQSQFNDSLDESSSKSVKLIRDQTFYKRALDFMMDGVLQICWEDELKKEPPKPLCLLQKHNETEFTAAERVQVDRYNEKLAKLRAHRKLYIDQLLDEKSSLETAIGLQVTKLNRCVENIIKTKVKAQFAISSEQLKILTCVRDQMRLKVIGEKDRKFV